MKFTATSISKLTNDKGEVIVQLTAEDRASVLYNYSKLKDYDKLSVEIKKHREKRSISANKYFWLIVNKIAVVLKTDKDSVYLMLLKRYGVSTYMTANKKAYERIKEQWRTVEIVDEKQQQGQDIVKLLCYYGSSTYTTKEFSHLLDGVISEAKELDIETITPQEKALMMESYEVER